MTVSRRCFMQWAAALSAAAVPTGRRLRAAEPTPFRADLLPSQNEVWNRQVWMNRLGPKYTGNLAHTEFVNVLAREMEALGLEVQRDRYTFTRWQAGPSYEQRIESSRGMANEIRATGRGASSDHKVWTVSSYFPYSGQTAREGVTGELVYVGKHPDVHLGAIRDKIALVDFDANTREWGTIYQPWGVHPAGETLPASVHPARAAINDLTSYQKAGALAVIIRWNDISNANAKDQYTPFSRPPQGIPGVYVDQSVGESLREAADAHQTVTVTLTARTIANTETDTVIATLPGASTDEVIILNTHTDGPNATEENGAIGLLALAKYFAKIPKSERRRTLVFPMTTGHFASPWVPSIRGFIEKHGDVIQRAVAAVTVEHLGCREWLDVAPQRYEATGKNEWSVAITPSAPMGAALVDALKGSLDRCAVVNPVGGGFLGEGSSLSRAGIPTIGYIPQPNYLLAAPADGCIDKLSPELMHSQIQVFAKLVHRLDVMSRAELKA